MGSCAGVGNSKTEALWLVARPRKDIDAEGVRKLAAMGCTQDEIGEFYGVDQSTISRSYASEFALGRGQCKKSLRRMQWTSARNGSVPMQIHLGNNTLGQSDKREVSGPAGGPIPVDISMTIDQVYGDDRDSTPDTA